MSQTIMDWILSIEQEVITRTEFSEIMRSGYDDEKAEAVQRMLEAGGYENLED